VKFPFSHSSDSRFRISRHEMPVLPGPDANLVFSVLKSKLPTEVQHEILYH
jgi:hypothetical protein